MISASGVQAILLGAGGFFGSTMAGVGVFRLFNAGAEQIKRIPSSLERQAEAAERTALAIEDQSVVLSQVLELKGLLMTTNAEIKTIRGEREEIGRELRIMRRRIEGINYPAYEQNHEA